MAYRATVRFKCDGCKVIESDPVEVLADVLQTLPPDGWLRVEATNYLDGLEVRAIKHYCRLCKPLIESYLAGRREEASADD